MWSVRCPRHILELHSDLQTELVASTGFFKVLCRAPKLNEIASVGRLIARRYLDGAEMLSLRVLNFTAESRSRLRRLRNSRLLPRVQTEKCETDLAGVDTGAKIFVGLKRGSEVG